MVINETHGARVEIDRFKSLVEMKPRACLFGKIEQHDVQIATVDRPDHFRVVASVTLELLATVEEVHHASPHHHRLLHHLVIGIRLPQRIAPAFGQCKVDGATAFIALDAWMAALLMHTDLPALARQQDGQQGAGEACADEGAGFSVSIFQGFLPQTPRQDSTSSTNRYTSMYLLYSGAGEMRITSGSRQSPSVPTDAR